MWSRVRDYFRYSPSRLRVARSIIELGLRVGEDGSIYCGPIMISNTKMANALNVDRRVIASTAKFILSEPELREVYTKIRPAGPSFQEVAKHLGFGVVVISADPKRVGIVAKVSTIIAEEGVGIRQILAEDPELFPEPKLTIITERQVPSEIIPKLRGVPGVEGVTIY
ncbi:MAG: amino acid-binding protein [Candidatus Bathyarchaeia archaeon]